MFKTELTEPVSFFFGLPNLHITNAHNRKLFNVLAFRKRNKLLNWISFNPPTLPGWYKIIIEHIPLDFLTCLKHYKTFDFTKMWKPFLEYINVNVSTILSRGYLKCVRCQDPTMVFIVASL